MGRWSYFVISQPYQPDKHLHTCDAEAIRLSLSLLSGAPGPKKVFVLTDGFTSGGLELPRVLKHAHDEEIDVIGMSVGMNETNVRSIYRSWVSAVFPSCLPNALRDLYSEDGPAADRSAHDGALRMRLMQAAGEMSKAEIHSERAKRHAKLAEKLTKSRKVISFLVLGTVADDLD